MNQFFDRTSQEERVNLNAIANAINTPEPQRNLDFGLSPATADLYSPATGLPSSLSRGSNSETLPKITADLSRGSDSGGLTKINHSGVDEDLSASSSHRRSDKREPQVELNQNILQTCYQSNLLYY